MGLSANQQFLVGAAQAASAEGYFHPADVGRSLGYSSAESARAVQALSLQKLVTPLQSGHVRLRHAGRAAALRLGRKAAAHPPTAPHSPR